MNITVLDGYTTSTGILSWQSLEGLGSVTIYDRSPRETLKDRLATTDIAVSNKIVWDKDCFEKAPNLRMIALLSTGYNVVDLEEANKRNIVVSNVPAYSTPDVAQHTFALLLEITNNVALHAQSVKDGEWCNCADFTYSLTPLIELDNKTLGIIGMGAIGQAVARIAKAFGMNVVFYNRSKKHDCEDEHTKQVSLDTLFTQADIISLHCAASEETNNIINKTSIKKMKDGTIILNTARGSLVNESDIATALKNGKLSAFGADVVNEEPMNVGNPLRSAPNAFVTPHIAWATKEARQRLLDTVVQNIIAFQNGAPQNVVNNVIF